jgi:Zn-finger nucleic acid-binding protein
VGFSRDVSYRDRPITCPRCGIELARPDDDVDDRWRCGTCRGALVGIEGLAHDLVAVAPELLPAGNVRDVTMIGRRSTEPAIACPACASPMAPVFLGGVELDRCDEDALVWFDSDEYARVIAAAREQRDGRPLRSRLVDALLGTHWPK